MKRKALLLTMLALCGSFTAGNAAEPNPPRIKFKAENPIQLPQDIYLGEVPAVATNSKGHIFIYSRGNSVGPAYASTAAQLLEFDANGKFLREIGHNLYTLSFAHAVRIDKNDNIWTVDKGSNVIMKFGSDGRVLDVFGRKPEASDYRAPPTTDKPKDRKAPVHRDGLFDQPTDVAWDSEGNAYITDGYENSRVGKIDKDGAWVKSWGERGTGPGQFLVPHGIVIDNKDNIYVADRGNSRIQVFDTNGKFLRQFTLRGQIPAFPFKEGTHNPNPIFMSANAPTRNDDPSVPKAYPDEPPVNLSASPGAPDAMCITPGANQVLYIGDINPSRVYKVSLEGKVLGILGEPGGKLGEFRGIHALTCQDEHTIWVGELLNWRAQKITMQ